MWSPLYEIMMYPKPVFIPMPTMTGMPFSYPLFQSFSTFPSVVNTQKIETTRKNISLQPNFVLSESESQNKAEEKLKFVSNMKDDLLKIIQFLLLRIDLETKVLEKEIQDNFSFVKVVGEQYFRTFISKLKKLVKTKEEIVKYCIRKAFKFVNQKIKDGLCVLDDNDILKEFLKGTNQNIGQSVPFLRLSNFKTMNSTFLSQLFSSEKFSSLYHEFLKVFPKICHTDNLRKIDSLSKIMHKHILVRSKDMKAGRKNIQKFNNFKRIPWTETVISKCLKIAEDLEHYGVKQLTNTEFKAGQ